MQKDFHELLKNNTILMVILTRVIIYKGLKSMIRLS
jgi:hypothetical protein